MTEAVNAMLGLTILAFVAGDGFLLLLIVSWDIQRERGEGMPVSEQVNAAFAEMQAAKEQALAKAQTAHEKETAAQQTRADAEAAKIDGKTANDTLDAKRAAFVAMVLSDYTAPGLPPPVPPTP